MEKKYQRRVEIERKNLQKKSEKKFPIEKVIQKHYGKNLFIFQEVTLAPFTRQETSLDLGIRKSRVCLPETKATQEKLERDEVAWKWGHAWLDDLFEEWQESKRPSTSTNEAFNATGPSDDEGPDEQSNIPLPEINNPEIPASFFE